MIPINIIPKPVKCVASGGSFTLTADTTIVAAARQARGGRAAVGGRVGAGDWLLAEGGHHQPQDAGTIQLRIDRSQTSRSATALGAEGYRLNVTPQQITISAPKPTGLFYGVQSLRQLLPPTIFREAVVQGMSWTIPCVEIEDAPRFAWRGMMLDPCRHFIPKEFVKKFIDLLALHKYNTLHWHLTDDQGWRVDQALSPVDRDRRVAEGDAGRQARMAQPQLR